MKNLIKINSTSFILGAVLGGLAIFTIAAESQHPTVWDYRVIEQGIMFPSDKDDTEALARYTKTTNGWEFVSVQMLADPILAQSAGPGACKMIIIQKKMKP